jgi:repressor LexA
MKTLTTRQEEVLAFLNDFIEKNSYPPTVRETAKAFSISIKGAYDHIKALEKKGVIKLQENRSRALEVIDRREGDNSMVEVPVLGTIAAGYPIFAEENRESSIKLPAGLAKAGRCFALRVKGESMKDAGIHPGDLAIIEQRSTAENGEIVAALIDDSATLKRFFRESSRIRLQAENPDFAPIFTQDVRILGVLKTIIRSY